MKTKASMIALALSCLLASCKPTGTVQCKTDASCNADADGKCLQNPATGNQWCSYPDGDCLSGLRWSDLDVGDSVGGACVALSVIDRTPPEIVSRTPEPDAQAASPSVVISVTFSEKIDPTSANAESVVLREEGAGGRALAVQAVVSGENLVLRSEAPLDPRRTYRVAVTSGVRDLAGNALARDTSWAFRTKEASWKAQVPLEVETSMHATAVDAAASNGVVIAAWEFAACSTPCEFTPSTEIWAAVFKDQAWSQAVKIGASSSGAFFPRVAVDGQGRGVVIWTKKGPSGSLHIMSSRYTGNAWQPAATVASFDPPYLLESAEVLNDGAGGMFAIWRATGSASQVHGARFSPAGGWDAPQRLDAMDSSVAGFALTTQGPDKAIAAWWQAGKLRTRRSEGGTWLAPVDGPDVAQLNAISVASSGAELTLVGHTSSSVLATSLRGGAWEAPVRLDEATAPAPSGTPVLKYLGNGASLAAWTAGADARYASRASAQAWRSSAALEPTNDVLVQLRMAIGGTRALAMFRSRDRSAVASNEYNASADWSGAENVPTSVDYLGADYVVVYDSASNTFVMVFLGGPLSPSAGVASVYAKTYQ